MSSQKLVEQRDALISENENLLADEVTPEPMDPRSQEISDLFFETILNRMEQAGFTESQLNEFGLPELDNRLKKMMGFTL